MIGTRGPAGRLPAACFDVQVDDVGHVLQGLARAGLATVVHLGFFDGAVLAEAGELHVLPADLEDRVDVGIEVLDAQGVAGDFVGDPVEQRHALLCESWAFFLLTRIFSYSLRAEPVAPTPSMMTLSCGERGSAGRASATLPDCRAS